MKSVSISGSPRANVGKKDAKASRIKGNIPCVIYGGKEQVLFEAPYNSFSHLIYSPDVQTANISVNGKEHKAIVQEIQFHPIHDRILHIDFLELQDNKLVTSEVPVKLKGVANGVKQGGKLMSPMRKLKIKALPANLPDSIEVNVEHLEIGQMVRVGEIKLKDVQILDAPNISVAAVRITRNVATDANAAAAPAAGAAPAAKAAAPAAKK